MSVTTRLVEELAKRRLVAWNYVGEVEGGKRKERALFFINQ